MCSIFTITMHVGLCLKTATEKVNINFNNLSQYSLFSLLHVYVRGCQESMYCRDGNKTSPLLIVCTMFHVTFIMIL